MVEFSIINLCGNTLGIVRIAVEEDLCRCGETLSDENISGIIGLLYFNIYKSLYQIYLLELDRLRQPSQINCGISTMRNRGIESDNDIMPGLLSDYDYESDQSEWDDDKKKRSSIPTKQHSEEDFSNSERDKSTHQTVESVFRTENSAAVYSFIIDGMEQHVTKLPR